MYHSTCYPAIDLNKDGGMKAGKKSRSELVRLFLWIKKCSCKEKTMRKNKAKKRQV